MKQYRYGERNDGGQKLLDFALEHKPYLKLSLASWTGANRDYVKGTCLCHLRNINNTTSPPEGVCGVMVWYREQNVANNRVSDAGGRMKADVIGGYTSYTHFSLDPYRDFFLAESAQPGPADPAPTKLPSTSLSDVPLLHDFWKHRPLYIQMYDMSRSCRAKLEYYN
ncbi:hypothetical protein EVAR_60400_1 [Eumeta japonica]|uniref:Uncharacterized protein n=1 Tax=Eumeta variegata TaxID=151549 RepID=A0A4C1YNG3_EUMVA|nr:hypothetical protein EVAR_60400_1 [Eumeta japonica]